MSAFTAPVVAIDPASLAFIEASRQGLALQTSAHVSTWHLGKEDHWSADLDAGTITFHFKNGKVANASIQVVGTYNQSDGTFLWGWDHPSVPGKLRHHAQLAREWGEKRPRRQLHDPPGTVFRRRRLGLCRCSQSSGWRQWRLSRSGRQRVRFHDIRRSESESGCFPIARAAYRRHWSALWRW